jgi:cytokinin dehydrogenase
MRTERSPQALAAATEDFGHVMRGSPTGIVRPRAAEDVVQIVTEAVGSGSRLTMRGLGHSAGGQALPRDSVVVDMGDMRRVGAVDQGSGTIRCEAGARLRDVVAATLESGLLPRSMTNLLDLTIGGLLSVGGVGPGSHRYGPMVANVESLDLVTSDGALRRCSQTVDRQLCDAVLGGLGRCGVIVEAELKLRPVGSRVRTYHLLYDDRRRWMEDQRTLLCGDRVTSMEGFCSPSLQGLRGTGGRRVPFAEWFFPVQVSLEYDRSPPELPDVVKPYRVVHVEDDAIAYFPARHDARFEAVRRLGAWDRAHPYIGAFIGSDDFVSVLPDVLGALPLGEGHRGIFFLTPDEVPPSMALPDATDIVFIAVLYPQVLPQFLDDTLAAFQRAADLLTEAGGKRYLADWLGEMDEAAWRRHFGSYHDQWVEAKKAFDPDGVFCSLLLP